MVVVWVVVVRVIDLMDLTLFPLVLSYGREIIGGIVLF